MSDTIVYRYGALAPVAGLDVLDEQMRLAHRYRNDLCAIEQRRRDGIARVQREHDTLGPVLDAVDQAEALVGELRWSLRACRSGAGKRTDVTGARELLASVLGDLAVLRWLAGMARARLLVEPDEKAVYAITPRLAPHTVAYARPWQRLGQAVYAHLTGHPGMRLACEYAIVDDTATVETKAARDACGLGSGTYMMVDDVAQQWLSEVAPPKMERYDGGGRVGVRYQGGRAVDALPSVALAGDVLRAPSDPQSPRQVARAIAYSIVSFCRAGDMTRLARHRRTRPDEEYRLLTISLGKGLGPVSLPVLLHRPLPDDASVRAVRVLRWRVGVRMRYEVQYTVRVERCAPTRTDRGVVALDIGARWDSARVARWVDAAGARGEITQREERRTSAGRSGHAGRKTAPNDLARAQSLQALRSETLDDVLAQIVAHRPRGSEAYREATRHARQWRSPFRVALLYRRRAEWAQASDDALIESLGAWLRQDRHLADWESSEREGYYRRRREQYREEAVRLARRYNTIVLAKRDYRRGRAERMPEDGPATEGHEGRVKARDAAPGEFCAAVKQAAAKYGARVVEVAVAGDTAWSVDWTVCERLLAHASGEVVTAQAEPLAAPVSNERTRGKRTRRRLHQPERRDPLAGQDVEMRDGA